MYIRFGEGCCRIARLNESSEVVVSKVDKENEVYAKALIEMVIESYPIIGVLYDTVEEIEKEREKEEEQERERYDLTMQSTGDEIEDNIEDRKTKPKGSAKYYSRLEGLLNYINDNYLSDYYGRLNYQGMDDEFLNGNNIWELRESLDEFIGDSGNTISRTLKVQDGKDGTGMMYNNSDGNLRIDKDSITFIVRAMTLKNYIARVETEDLLDDKITVGTMLRKTDGYIFVDFGKDIYVLK